VGSDDGVVGEEGGGGEKREEGEGEAEVREKSRRVRREVVECGSR